MTCLFAHETLFYVEFAMSWMNQVYHRVTPDNTSPGLVDFGETYYSSCSLGGSSTEHKISFCPATSVKD